MRSLRIFIALICLGFTSLVTEAFITIKNKHITKPEATGKGFAVVELFTSEGCSSCPPADVLVAKLQKESADKPVYILAFHVDYWNRLGWKDVFSSHEYSSRQYQYSKWLKSEVYTPQVIVNGRTEFVGSDEKSLGNAIKTGLEKTAKTELTLNNENIVLPHGFDPQKFELIGFVQNGSNGEITGATKAQVPTGLSTKL